MPITWRIVLKSPKKSTLWVSTLKPPRYEVCRLNVVTLEWTTWKEMETGFLTLRIGLREAGVPMNVIPQLRSRISNMTAERIEKPCNVKDTETKL